MVEVMDPPEARTLHEDLVAALGELAEVATDGSADTGQYTYRYVTLAAMMRAVRAPLAAHGFVVTQLVSSADGELSVTTVLVHRSGNMHQSGALRVKLPPTAQALGSWVSYARRYQLAALLGIVGEDDDDGQRANPPARKRAASSHPRRTSTTTTRRPTDARNSAMGAMFNELGYSDRSDRLALTGQIIGRQVESWNDLDDAEKSRVLDYLSHELEGPPHEEGY